MLGAMLLSKDAIADVVESIRADDFYRPSHSTIYDTILDLYGRGEPADAVTVASELTKSGEITRIGGPSYLHTLVSLVPTAANANYYGRIVREQAILRRLVTAGTRIVHLGYSGQGEVDDAVDRAQAEVYEVTERRASEDYAPLSDIMQGTLSEIEAISNRDGEMVGVPTGFAELDTLTNGLHAGQLIIVAARPALGRHWLLIPRSQLLPAGAHKEILSPVIGFLVTTVNQHGCVPPAKFGPTDPVIESHSVTVLGLSRMRNTNGLLTLGHPAAWAERNQKFLQLKKLLTRSDVTPRMLGLTTASSTVKR